MQLIVVVVIVIVRVVNPVLNMLLSCSEALIILQGSEPLVYRWLKLVRQKDFEL